jgi:hypothetical protein
MTRARLKSGPTLSAQVVGRAARRPDGTRPTSGAWTRVWAARLQSGVRFAYTVEVLDELRRHGVVPTGATDPQLVRDFLSALYRYEIRRLKARLLSGEFPQREYASRVRALRRGYVLLSIPLETWTRRG